MYLVIIRCDDDTEDIVEVWDGKSWKETVRHLDEGGSLWENENTIRRLDEEGSYADYYDDSTGSYTESPTQPTAAPTGSPTQSPTAAPTESPTRAPTAAPTGSPTQSPTAAPTESPTQSPTAAPTESPTRAPTTAPTAATTKSHTVAPTFTPTKPPTLPDLPPLPNTVDLASVDAIDMAVVTLAPTAAPTAYPTHEGYKAVEKEVVVAVLKVEGVHMPGVTPEQARMPTMRKALEDGFSKSLGLDAAAKLTAVGGVPVSRRMRSTAKPERTLRGALPDSHASRRLATAGSILTFEVEAGIAENDSAAVSALQVNIGTVLGLDSAGGSLVAFIKQEAATLGVLTTELAAIPNNYDAYATATKPILSTSTQSKTIVVQQRPTPVPSMAPTAPTKVPTKVPTSLGPLDPFNPDLKQAFIAGQDDDLDGGAIAGIITAVFVALLAAAYATASYWNQSSPAQHAVEGKQSTNKLVWRHANEGKVAPVVVEQ